MRLRSPMGATRTPLGRKPSGGPGHAVERAQPDRNDAAVPVMLAHGEEDEDVPIAMSRACAEAYTRVGPLRISCRFLAITTHHRPNARGWRSIQEGVLGWLMSGRSVG